MSKGVSYTGLTKVQFNDGFCGSGKTHWMIDKVSQSGKYVIAVDRREVIPERIRLIKEKLGAAKLLRLRYEAIHSDDAEFEDALKKSQSVSSQIFGKMAEFESANHAIIFITHAGMKLCDFRSNDPAGWTLVIDEVPSLAETDHHTTPNSYDFLSQNYAISSSTRFSGLGEIRLADTHISADDLKHDDAHKAFLNLHNGLLAGRTVLTDLLSWRYIDKEKRQWAWTALWEMENLEGFDEIFLLGNSFCESISHHLISNHMSHRIALIAFDIPNQRQWVKRPVTIEYFAENHIAGSYFFKNTIEGRNIITSVGNHLAYHKGNDHIWSANIAISSKLKKCGVPGIALSPKQAGTNAYQDIHNASFIYSSKQHPADKKIHEALGISKELVWKDRELEAGVQFFMRTSLRDPNSPNAVTLTAYDSKVADQLKAYLDYNYGFNCLTVKVGDPAKFRRSGGGAKAANSNDSSQLSKKEKAAVYAANYRKREVEKKKAAGVYRGRGRPSQKP